MDTTCRDEPDAAGRTGSLHAANRRHRPPSGVATIAWGKLWSTGRMPKVAHIVGDALVGGIAWSSVAFWDGC